MSITPQFSRSVYSVYWFFRVGRVTEIAMQPPALILFFAALILMPALLMALWNLTIPEIFGLPEIGCWQALRLALICSFLFGGPFVSYHSS
jgi:hypothetical protein